MRESRFYCTILQITIRLKRMKEIVIRHLQGGRGRKGLFYKGLFYKGLFYTIWGRIILYGGGFMGERNIFLDDWERIIVLYGT